MAINFTSDIQALFNSKIVTDAAYQSGGTYLTGGFGALTLATVAIHAGSGTGYAAGNTVTLSGGTLYSGGSAATVKVVTVSGGVPATLLILTPGSYAVKPSNPISVTGGAGSGLTIDATWTGDAQQRILTFIEICRAYMAVMDNVHEAKVFMKILGRMKSTMHFGSTTWDTTNEPLNAQKQAMRYLSKHLIPTDI